MREKGKHIHRSVPQQKIGEREREREREREKCLYSEAIGITQITIKQIGKTTTKIKMQNDVDKGNEKFQSKRKIWYSQNETMKQRLTWRE